MWRDRIYSSESQKRESENQNVNVNKIYEIKSGYRRR